MVVRSDVATVSIPELEFEVPPQKGQITTVESIIQQAIANLELEQPYRMVRLCARGREGGREEGEREGASYSSP